jgi:hypothetical protein
MGVLGQWFGLCLAFHDERALAMITSATFPKAYLPAPDATTSRIPRHPADVRVVGVCALHDDLEVRAGLARCLCDDVEILLEIEVSELT